jgi:riboflavin kinase/FMN adenylyltransferase
VTFANHPATHLRPADVPPLLTSLDERVNLIARAGIDELYLVPFDDGLASLEPEAFLLDLLVARLGAKAIVVGENFRFGAGRKGDTKLAERVLSARGVGFTAVPSVVHAGARVSSTRIRSALAEGDLAAANALLGEPYTLRGRVVLGEGRGHDLGFPTANLEVETGKALPKDGVYAMVARHDGRDFPGLVSIGSKPTFPGKPLTIEAWLRDFDRTIYGEEVTLRDLRFLRDQQRFASIDELRRQIVEDTAAVPFPSFAS